MAVGFRKSTGWPRLAAVSLIATLFMLVDAKTDWLNGPRNVLSIVVSPIQYLASTPTRVGRLFSNTLSAEIDNSVAYKNLRKEYFKLKSEALLLRSLAQENTNLRELLGAAPRLSEKITLASLVNVSIDPNNHSVLVGRGLRDGVYSGQAVIDDRGVVGQVTEVMPYNSSVLLISDPGHALPVQIRRTGLRTVVYGTGNATTLRVPFLNENSDIKEGDILVSSGLGGRFPSGYPVATVTEVEIIQDAAFMRVSARPSGKLDRSDHVLLLSRQQLPAQSVASVMAESSADSTKETKETEETEETEETTLTEVEL